MINERAEMMNVDYVVLGGGVAGLCAARRLVELGIKPLVIEAGSYPSHKVCGEFISSSSLAILNKWDIHPILLHQARLYTSSHTFNFIFPTPAGSLSHLTLDTQLAHQISQQGATLLTQTKVQNLFPASDTEEFHKLHLSSGETILAKHLLIATGRLLHFSDPSPRMHYMGFKTHFTGLDLDQTLNMFSFPGAYLGLSPIENGRANLACLAKIERVQQDSSPQHFMQNLIQSHPFLRQLLASGSNLFDSWMEARVPKFGLRSVPHWPRTYWIGDAASTIPPACGNGLSLALASGYLAAEFAICDDPLGFKHSWQQRCSSQILFGKGLHHLFLHPSLGNKAMRISHWFPFLAQKIFDLTRDPGF
jgi:flavin-dependent dehydrogenase